MSGESCGLTAPTSRAGGVNGRVLAIQQAKRVLVVPDSQILIDQIEHAIRVGTEVQPEVWVGVAGERPFVSEQAARGIERQPIPGAFARLARAALTTKQRGFERARERHARRLAGEHLHLLQRRVRLILAREESHELEGGGGARRSKPLGGLEMGTRIATAAGTDQRQAEVVPRLEVGRVARVRVLEPPERTRRRIRPGIRPCQRNREPSSGFREREAVRVALETRPIHRHRREPTALQFIDQSVLENDRPPTSPRIAWSAGSAAGRHARPMRVCDRTCSPCGSEPPFRLRPAIRT